MRVGHCECCGHPVVLPPDLADDVKGKTPILCVECPVRVTRYRKDRKQLSSNAWESSVESARDRLAAMEYADRYPDPRPGVRVLPSIPKMRVAR